MAFCTLRDMRSGKTTIATNNSATFIIDPKGIVRSVNVSDAAVGRNTNEILRTVAALSTVSQKTVICPPNWVVDGKTTTVSPIDAYTYFQQNAATIHA
jgi:alkyl hydroperoxide reductase subunit AhpC